MTYKTLNPPPASHTQASNLSIDAILARLPTTERDAIRARTAELLLGSALKQKLAERAAARTAPHRK